MSAKHLRTCSLRPCCHKLGCSKAALQVLLPQSLPKILHLYPSTDLPQIQPQLGFQDCTLSLAQVQGEVQEPQTSALHSLKGSVIAPPNQPPKKTYHSGATRAWGWKDEVWESPGTVSIKEELDAAQLNDHVIESPPSHVGDGLSSIKDN